MEKTPESEKAFASRELTREERQQMRHELLKQAAVKLENARINWVMTRAAYEALLNDEES